MRKGTGKRDGEVGGKGTGKRSRSGPELQARLSAPSSTGAAPGSRDPPPPPHEGIFAVSIARAAPPAPQSPSVPPQPPFPPRTPRSSPAVLPLVRPQRSPARPSPSATLRRRYFLLKGPRPALRFFLLKGPRCERRSSWGGTGPRGVAVRRAREGPALLILFYFLLYGQTRGARPLRAGNRPQTSPNSQDRSGGKNPLKAPRPTPTRPHPPTGRVPVLRLQIPLKPHSGHGPTHTAPEGLGDLGADGRKVGAMGEP